MKLIYKTRLELAKESEESYPYQRITNKIDMEKLARTFINVKSATESFFVFGFNVKNELVCACEVARGGSIGVSISMADIVKPILVSGAVGLATCHNHPSGDCTPSPEDLALWKQIDKAADLLGLRSLDHLILGENQFHAEKG